MRLYKGNVTVVSRRSEESLFDTKISTFDDDGGAYNQADAGGFIKLNALRMRIAANKAAARKAAAPRGRTKAAAAAPAPAAAPAAAAAPARRARSRKADA